MLPLFSARATREADRYAMEGLGIPEVVLMEHAALGLTRALENRFGKLLPNTRGVILAGPGNNGGDVLAAARQLESRGCQRLYVVLLGEESRLSDSCALQLRMLGKLGIPWTRELEPQVLAACDWILDGIFGTGLTREVEGDAREVIDQVNAFAGKKWIVAADIPSGLDADRGIVLGTAIRASETITFGFLKRGLVTGLAADHVGRLTLEPIQIPRSVPIEAEALLYREGDAARLLPQRVSAGHKGLYGHVYVWAGSPERQGASLLTSVAALRAGAGLVTLVGDEASVAAARPRLLAEIMTQAWKELPAPKAHDALAMGPGMGVSAESWTWLKRALQSPWPLVLDADAITLLAEHRAEAKALCAARGDRVTVLTPHPKEAARLLGVERISDDRYEALGQLIDEWPAQILLKGKGTLVGGSGRPPIVVTAGSPALSKGGSGDILTGIIAAFLAQGLLVEQAVPLAAFVHGRASERLAEARGETRSALASEIAEWLPAVFKEIESWKGD